ncbi:MAG: alcohol dehydrogenase catalytic domain-containing protein, partial [Pseudomonadota bacterium]
MKALVKSQSERGLWMQDVPKPKVGHNDVLIKVSHTAICGTDIHIYQWDDWARGAVPVPMVIGHEFSGTIVELGSEVRGFHEGDRVSASRVKEKVLTAIRKLHRFEERHVQNLSVKLSRL